MAMRADIVVHGPDGTPVAIVEVKNREELSADVAAVLRRNLVLHGLPASVPFFVLVSQEAGFLWKDGPQQDPGSPPTQQFSMRNVLRRYLPKLDPNDRLRGLQLELLVQQWLSDLANSALEPRPKK